MEPLLSSSDIVHCPRDRGVTSTSFPVRQLPEPATSVAQARLGIMLLAAACVFWTGVTVWAVLHKDTDGYFFVVWVPPGPVLLVWLILPAMSGWAVLRRVAQRRWWPVLRAAIIPALALAAALAPTEISIRYHFWREHAAYDRTIRSALASGTCQPQPGPTLDGIDCRGPVIAIFPWGGFAQIWRGVVYDASDEIVRDPGQRSAIWRQRSTGDDLGCAMVVERFTHHFYFVFSAGTPARDGTCS